MNKRGNDAIRPIDIPKNLNGFYSSREYWQQAKRDQDNRVKNARPTVVIIPELSGSMPSPCSYIRLLDPLMSRRVQECFKIRFGDLESVALMSADAIILNRVPCSDVADLDKLLQHIDRSKTKLIYEIDDNLLNLTSNHPEKLLYKEKEAVVRKLVAEADVVWTSTDPLAESLGPLAREVQVFENSIDLHLLEGEKKAHSKGNTFSILYMGTKTHSADLSLVMGALDKIHSEGIAFDLTLIGVSEAIPNVPWIKKIDPPAVNYPLFMQWLRSLPQFDLGIAPLEATTFNKCKSAVKFWDYTSMGVPTLASNFGAYKKIIVNGETGYLADNNTEDWFEQIRSAISNPKQRGNILHQAVSSLKKLHAELNGSERRKNALVKLTSLP